MSKIAVLADFRSTAPADRHVAPQESEANLPTRDLACNTVLFEAGDVKTHLFRIETGVLCVYTTRWDGKPEVIEFAFAGDIVGMGFLERHACSARATVDTRIAYLPLEAMDRIGEQGERAKARLKQAVAREFDYRRESLVAAGRGRPAARVAAFLVALSRRNAVEGRDPCVIDDTLSCSVVADYLALNFDSLALALVELRKQGLVQPASNRALLINDVDALEALSNDGPDPLERAVATRMQQIPAAH